MNKTTKVILIIAGIVLALAVVPSLIWGGRGSYYGGMMGPGMMGGFGVLGWFGPILMVLFWVLVVWGVIALIRGAGWGGTGESGRPDSAIEILKRRYARGDISKEEFEAKKKDLE